MAKKLDEAGFSSSVADPDVWMRPATHADGTEYYEYILMYIDDLLSISEDATSVLRILEGDTIRYKNDKIAPPEVYLGAKLAIRTINGIEVWTITSQDYVKAAIDTIKLGLKNKRWKLPSYRKTPTVNSYIPELDGSPELDSGDTAFFQEMIGMLRWATELGRVDILTELSILSQYQASPREGHLEETLRIFAFLEEYPKLTLYMDPDQPNLNYSLFKTDPEAFKEYYRDAHEELPHRMPKPRGIAVVTTAWVDASHAANKVTRRSHTGYILFVNRAPVKWVSRRQQTVESSAFSSEFIAMKQCLEDVEHLRFKLRMFGIPFQEDWSSTHVLADNDSMVKNSTKVESTLNKKHSSIAYHFTRWCIAARIAVVAWCQSGENLADAFTKRLSQTMRNHLFGNWTY